jgi:site-specific DNA-methyltransferase (adenine-specific)
MNNCIYFADNLTVLPQLATASVPLIYIDPPFNRGGKQVHTQLQTVQSPNGDRVGFQGRRYATTKIGTREYNDTFADFYGFLEERLVEAYRVLANNGTMYFHIDYQEVHYCKVLIDSIFGRECFLNEIIWAYDYGGRTRKKWPPKHDNILVYVKDPANYIFNYEDIERIPYMAPGLVGPEKAEC